MKMTKSVKNHFTTAQLLLTGVEESMGVEPDKWGIIPPEHSKASMIRRCVQARQEILQVQKALEVHCRGRRVCPGSYAAYQSEGHGVQE